jgi:hypothetical protein
VRSSCITQFIYNLKYRYAEQINNSTFVHHTNILLFHILPRITFYDLFQFRITSETMSTFRYLVWLTGRVSACLRTSPIVQDNTIQKDVDKHPCLEWDSNSRTQCSSAHVRRFTWCGHWSALIFHIAINSTYIIIWCSLCLFCAFWFFRTFKMAGTWSRVDLYVYKA